MQLFLGDIYALQGKYADAAKVYKKVGQPSRALTMYTDLRMFDLAKVSTLSALKYSDNSVSYRLILKSSIYYKSLI